MDEIWDYLTEEQKREVATATFNGFIKAINDYNFKEDVARACDGLVDHIMNESTPELLTEHVKAELEKYIIKKITSK